MLVNQLSALLAAIPMAAALSVRGGPGGWHGGRGGHGGPHGGGHGPDPDEPFQFRIVTYDIGTQRTEEYFELGPEVLDTDTFPLLQTDEEEASGVFEVTEDGYLVYNSPERVIPAVGPLIAAFDPATLEDPAPWQVVFASEETIDGTPKLTEWVWEVDYDDYTLHLLRPGSSTPYCLLLCLADDEYFLAVGVTGGEPYQGCVATHLDIEPVDDEDHHHW